MSYPDVWNALAARFEDVAADAPIELANYPEDARDFEWEVLRSRVLFRYREDEQVQTDRLFSIRADGPEPFIRRRRVNRFRWLCNAAGVLLDPHIWYRCGEVVWFDHLTSGRHDLIPDAARLSADAARRLARHGQSPPARRPDARPEWWTNQRPLFVGYAQRFSSPLFHGTTLRMTVGQRRLPGDEAPDQDNIDFDRERRWRKGGDPARFEIHKDEGGTIWGDERAVREFKTIAGAAARSLPAELTLGIGPTLFPPTDLTAQTYFGPAWHKWGVIMWALSPSNFTTELPTDHSSPVVTAGGCLESIAAGVCQQFAATENYQLLKRDIRLKLAGGNPWLNQDDRCAARRAIEAAYTPATTAVQPAEVRDRTRNRQPGSPLPKWDGTTNTLTYGSLEVKQYRRSAKNQMAVLAAFERVGWCESIPNPIPSKDLNATVRDTNKSLGAGSPIRLRMDGTGAKVVWERTGKEPAANSPKLS